jgi:formylglycine-generating enzyme required for sulfatase activity
MVHIPESQFYAGDGVSSMALKQGSSDADPWQITSEAPIAVSNVASDGFYYPGGGDPTGSDFTIPERFPKGFRAFYLMRYEITQEQWRDFFNTLPTSSIARTNRDCTSASGKNSDQLVTRNNISWPDVGSAVLPDQGDGATYCAVPMNYMSWGDLAAYLDWAGLRPMTELEFEKAARGAVAPLASEFAWGSSSFSNASGVTYPGLPSEVAANAGANVNWLGGLLGPLRSGSFAALNYGGSSRIGSGGGFYGALELSGNLRERVVTIGNAQGRLFTGLHGDGELGTDGDANVEHWPGLDALGTGFRGGSWNDPSDYSRISDRQQAATSDDQRAAHYGGRGARH